MSRIIEISRIAAIQMSKEKSNMPIFLYVKGEDPIYNRDISFVSQDTKNSNTETFIMLNKQNIAFANGEVISKIKLKSRIRKFKEEAIKWRCQFTEYEKKKSYMENKDKHKYNSILANLLRMV